MLHEIPAELRRPTRARFPPLWAQVDLVTPGRTGQVEVISGRNVRINRAADLRPSVSIAYSVGKALFLREAVSRLAAGRAAWLWILLEPVAHVAFIMALFTFVRMRVVPGAEVALWLLTGLVTFFTARDAATRSMEAIKANKALFAYRQVLPVDTVLTRSAVEGFIGMIVALLLLADQP